jgi:hypothetical protein
MRGLSKDLAVAGHDFFEVVFHYRAASAANDVIARTSWELYKEARITGVRGKRAGDPATSYGTGTPSVGYTSIYGGTNVAPTGSGAAILFVGKKTDRTLLAVGRLTATTIIDSAGNNVAGPATTISTNTRSVTFDVSALESGVAYRNGSGADPTTITPPTTEFAQSSFFTSYRDAGNVVNAVNTTTATITIPPSTGRTFPQFMLRMNSVTEGWYYFKLSGGVNIDTFTPGIILAGAGDYGRKQPRYPMPNGDFQYSSLRLDDSTKVEAVNNIVSPTYSPLDDHIAFVNPVKAAFDTAGTAQGSAFAYVFEIPVHPLSAVPASDDGPAAGTWYIRPSYDSFFLDLDSGPGSSGGAVLIRTGNFEGPTNFRIRVVLPPFKWKYLSRTTSPPLNLNAGGRDFNIWGLVVRLENEDEDHTLIRYLEPHELTFELGMRMLRPNVTNPALPLNPAPGLQPGLPPNPAAPQASRDGEDLDPKLFGLNIVYVHYMEPSSGITKSDQFAIICDEEGTTTFTNIPDGHYFRISSLQTEDSDIASTLNYKFPTSAAGTYVIVIDRDFNFPIVTSQNPGDNYNNSLLIIFVAGIDGSNVRVGRVDNGTAATAWSTRNGYYFGKWPFRDPLSFTGTGFNINNINTNGHTNGVLYTGTHSEPSSDGTYTYPFATYGYTLNAGGYYNNSTLRPGNTRPFIFYGHNDGGRVYNVTVDEYVTLHNEEMLY